MKDTADNGKEWVSLVRAAPSEASIFSTEQEAVIAKNENDRVKE